MLILKSIHVVKGVLNSERSHTFFRLVAVQVYA